ncbi:MAG TPA: tetratricopeptide repeat protein [Candidatus Kapabacteria bacterium]|nr:tetratricopeptide repeat protein [Candidatus Kapabacteria bacterium]
MMRAGVFILICGMLALSSCVKKDENTMFRLAEEDAQHAKWTEAVAGYNEVLKDFPSGKHAADAMFRIGIIQTNQLKDYAAGMKMLQQVAEQFPASDVAPKALMTLGFLYANQPDVKNLDLAKKYYGQIVTQYPTNELATSANIELENLGRSPQDMLQSAQESNKPVFSHDTVIHAPSAQALAH